MTMTNTDRKMAPRAATVAQDIENLIRAGVSAAQAARDLGCDESYAQRIASVVRQGFGRMRKDSSEPKFADHKRHVAACMKEGGFCAFSETPLRHGRFGLGLPMIWPAPISDAGDRA